MSRINHTMTPGVFLSEWVEAVAAVVDQRVHSPTHIHILTMNNHHTTMTPGVFLSEWVEAAAAVVDQRVHSEGVRRQEGVGCTQCKGMDAAHGC